MRKLLILLGCMISTMATSQQFSEKINKEFTFEKKTPDNAIIVANINGDIKVTGYNGDKVIVEVNRQIFGKTEARLQKGKEELQLGVLDRADTLIFYVIQGCNQFGQKMNGKNSNGWYNNGWGYNWDCKDRDCQPQYDYTMDFTIKVPTGTHVAVSTVNDGDIVVENVRGSVDADNVNGSIKLTNLVREAAASTINGDVDIEYTTNPSKDCRFYTLNGDINAVFQKGLAASLSFESFNGSFYTNMDNLTKLPAQVVKSSKGDGIKYKLTGNRYQVGNGGAAYLDFETFNGDVYLKEKVN
jgi:DUF4097 and DUF4098 domain-containing protein YvlB